MGGDEDINNVLNQATALIMSSLVVLSSQALAFSSNNRELRNTGVLGNSEFLIVAQCLEAECSSKPVKPQQRIDLAQSILIADTAVGNAWAVTQASSIPNTVKDAINSLLAEATTIIDNAIAFLQSNTLTRGGAAAIAESIARAELLIGDASAIAQSIADSEDGRTVAQAIVIAQIACADAVPLVPVVAQ